MIQAKSTSSVPLTPEETQKLKQEVDEAKKLFRKLYDEKKRKSPEKE